MQRSLAGSLLLIVIALLLSKTAAAATPSRQVDVSTEIELQQALQQPQVSGWVVGPLATSATPACHGHSAAMVYSGVLCCAPEQHTVPARHLAKGRRGKQPRLRPPAQSDHFQPTTCKPAGFCLPWHKLAEAGIRRSFEPQQLGAGAF